MPVKLLLVVLPDNSLMEEVSPKTIRPHRGRGSSGDPPDTGGAVYGRGGGRGGAGAGLSGSKLVGAVVGALPNRIEKFAVPDYVFLSRWELVEGVGFEPT